MVKPDKRIPLTPGEHLTLKALLESMAAGAGYSHYWLACSALDKFRRSRKDVVRRVCAVEVFCKLMQGVEDMGAFCLMWLRAEEGRDPLHAYLKVTTRQIKNFYGRCLDGLPRKEVLTILALREPDEMLQDRSLSVEVEEAFRLLLEQEVERRQAHLAKMAKLFSQQGSSPKEYVHADVLNMFFNAKHGVKMLLPVGVGESHLHIGKDEVAVIVAGTPATDGTSKEIVTGSFPLDDSMLAHMVDNLEFISGLLVEWARTRRAILDDPDWMAKQLNKVLKHLSKADIEKLYSRKQDTGGAP